MPRSLYRRRNSPRGMMRTRMIRKASNLRKTRHSSPRRTKRPTERYCKTKCLEFRTSTCYTRSITVKITYVSRLLIRKSSRTQRTWIWRKPQVQHELVQTRMAVRLREMKVARFSTEWTTTCTIQVARTTQTWLVRAHLAVEILTSPLTTPSSLSFDSANRSELQVAFVKEKRCQT